MARMGWLLCLLAFCVTLSSSATVKFERGRAHDRAAHFLDLLESRCQPTDLGSEPMVESRRVCPAKLHDRLEGSKLLNGLEPHGTTAAMRVCLAIEGCKQADAAETVGYQTLLNIASRPSVISFTAKFASTSPMLSLIKSMIKGLCGEEAAHQFKPLMEFLFDLREGADNPFCDPAAAQDALDVIVPVLLTPTGSLANVSEIVVRDQRELFEMMTRQFFTTDCPTSSPTKSQSASKKKSKSSFVPYKHPLVTKVLSVIESASNSRSHAGEKKVFELTQQALENYASVHGLGSDPLIISPYWRKMAAAMGAGGPVFPSQLSYNTAPLTGIRQECNCHDLEIDVALRTLRQLTDIGLDFGNITMAPLDAANPNPKEARLASDIPDIETHLKTQARSLGFENIAQIGRQIEMVEASALAPEVALRYFIRHMSNTIMVIRARGKAEAKARKAAGTTQEGGSKLPVAPSNAVKGMLVALPTMQNVWSGLMQDAHPELFSQKSKWFVVLNIAWAVWHQIELVDKIPADKLALHHQNVLMGLWTLQMAIFSDFSYNTTTYKLQQTNDDEFTQYYVALYTMWNFAFVETAVNEKPAIPMLTLALGIPILESIANHGDVAYWVNYRRDQLMHTLFDYALLD